MISLYILFTNIIDWSHYVYDNSYISAEDNVPEKIFYLVYIDKILKYDLNLKLLDSYDLYIDTFDNLSFLEKDLFFSSRFFNKELNNLNLNLNRFGAYYDINRIDQDKKWIELEEVDKERLYDNWLNNLYDRFVSSLNLKVENLKQDDFNTVAVFVFYEIYTDKSANNVANILKKIFSYYYQISKMIKNIGKINRVDILNTKEILLHLQNSKVKVDIEQDIDLQIERLKLVINSYELSNLSYIDITSTKIVVLK